MFSNSFRHFREGDGEGRPGDGMVLASVRVVRASSNGVVGI